MAATLTLVKAPALQKLLVLVLLSLGGLGYPPPLAEAIKCYECSKGEPCKQVDCISGYTHCSILQVGGVTSKTCASKNGQQFDCLQQKVGGSGNCIEGSVDDFNSASGPCNYNGRTPDGKVDITGIFTLANDTSARRPGHGASGLSFSGCMCASDLCNDSPDSARNAVPEQMVGAGRKGLQAVIIGGIMLLATNGLFY